MGDRASDRRGESVRGRTQEDILAADPEVFVTVSALDETFSQPVHARFSYADEEIVHGAKFVDLFGTTGDGVLTVDLSRLSEVDRVALPEAARVERV